MTFLLPMPYWTMSLAKLPKLKPILLHLPTLLLRPLTPAGLVRPQELLAFPLPPVPPSRLAQAHLVSTPAVPLVLDSSNQALEPQGSIPVHPPHLVGFLLLQESLGHTPLGREPQDSFQEAPEPQDSFQEAPEPQDSFQEAPEPQDSFQEDPELQDNFREDPEALASIPQHQDRTLLEEALPNPSRPGSQGSFPLVPTLPQGSTLTCRMLEDSLPKAPTDQELPVPIPLRRTPATFQGQPSHPGSYGMNPMGPYPNPPYGAPGGSLPRNNPPYF
ncbi:hypothetical protein COCON_G00017430 [Conger conger]|uniref:Uncharacterized protein n=1 Tax=Conger conger TaxID=82655 RepID=A0A9Q1E3T8_CONCO|nr:hypothetical protein COCON_G00017430 [Conger conger]